MQNKLKDLAPKYDFKKVEEGKYDYWLSEGLFTPKSDPEKKPYTIVIPPPNITGKLHLGHVWDTTLQDIIIRRKRMQGYDTLYLPGMDHASIATQAKVEAKLREQGISRYDLGKEKFLEVAWKWKEDYAKTIREQWKVIGLSLDYTRERFTLDAGLNRAVNTVFKKMYDEGLIYRGEKIINWDIQAKTALSNIEVEYRDVEGGLYHFLYPFTLGGKDGLTVATTRPETMFGDVALMVNPNDERYASYIGKTVYIPGTEKQIPVIGDEYVDISFGTGVVKVTPAHDPNDFEVGNRHGLPRIICMSEDGHMLDNCGKYEGMDRYECRDAVTKDLQELGYCTKVEKYIHSVGHSERTGVEVEPRLSKQWFVKMEPLVKSLLEMQANEETKIHFVPEHFEAIFNNWLSNIQDWCISRQLWWGHQIPAWYKGEEIYVGLTAPEGEGWVRDEDALDTWFSSALWPFSTLGWPDDTFDLKHYFPTDTLVTGYDIIFFWVARMAFQSKYLTGVRPFKNVLIHGIIRDELGRKVSKSLNNGVDMMDAVNQYGIDALRYFLTTTTSPGQDIRYSDTKMEAAWNFINKIWNIARYIGLTFENHGYNGEEIDFNRLNVMDKWILSRLNDVIRECDNNFEKFEFGEVASKLYNFIWNDFASWYLEMTKVVLQGEADKLDKINTCAVLHYCLDAILKLMHPFMPFATEDIYMSYHDSSISISSWPKANEAFDFSDAKLSDVIFDIITCVRNIRAEKNVAPSKKITLIVKVASKDDIKFLEDNDHYISRFTNYEEIDYTVDNVNSDGCVFRVLDKASVYAPLKDLVNLEEERAKLESEKQKMIAEVSRCKNMLSNPNFVSKAPEAKIKAEQEKLKGYEERLAVIIKLLEEI